MGLGRAGGPRTPTRCAEIQSARCVERAEGAVRCSVDAGRWGHGSDGGDMFATSGTPHARELLDPIHQPSDRLAGHATWSSPQASSGRLVAPTSPNRPPARGRRTGPRDCVRDHAVRGHSASSAPCLARKKLTARSPVRRSSRCWVRASIEWTSARQDGRPFGRNERHAPSPPALGRANLGTGAKWCLPPSQWGHEEVAKATHRTFCRLELVSPRTTSTQVKPVMLNQQDRVPRWTPRRIPTPIRLWRHPSRPYRAS